MTITEFENEQMSDNYSVDFASAEDAFDDCLRVLEIAVSRVRDLRSELDMEADFRFCEAGYERLAQLEIAAQQANDACTKALHRMEAILAAESRYLSQLAERN